MLVAYLAVFPSILSYLLWNSAALKLRAHRAGLFDIYFVAISDSPNQVK